jgi:hypothetical protein
MSASSSLFVNLNNGNVGIGTALPIAALDITGNMNVTGNISAGNMGMFRNRIINGDMRVNQRGPTYTNISGSGVKVYTFDRWFFQQNATAGNSITQITGLTDLGEITTAARLQRPNGSTTGTFYFGQALESQDSRFFKNQSVTFSFYLRAGANLSGNITVSLVSGTGTDQDAGNIAGGTWTGNNNFSYTIITSGSISTSSWSQTIINATVPSNCNQLGFLFTKLNSGTAGANDYIDITGVQFEKGTFATPFEYRPFSVELQLCQRYFQVGNPISGLASSPEYYYGSSSGGEIRYPLPVMMRIAPTPSTITQSNGSYVTFTQMLRFFTTTNAAGSIYFKSLSSEL